MTIKYLGDAIYKVSVAGERPPTAVNGAMLIETDSRQTFYYNGTTWLAEAGGGTGTGASEGDSFTWLIYKSGSNYKAKNGFTGTVPTGATSTSMDALWTWLKANYVQTAAGEPMGKGLIQFYKGTFTFTATGGAAAIDPSGWGTNAPHLAGPYIRGMRRDTKLVFTPTAATESAFTIENQTDSGLQDLDISINSNVTNAIKLTANSPGEGSQRALFENLKITRTEVEGGSPPTVAGQRGIYLITPVYTTGGNVFFTTIRRVTTRFMDTGIEMAGTAEFNNTHAVNIDDCGFWGSTKCINMGDRCSQNFISKILGQNVNDTVTSQPTLDYVIRVGVQTRFNNIYNVSVDAMAKAGSCIVRLEDQADYNKISGLVNSGVGTPILDYSGRYNNEYDNIMSVGGITHRMKEGRWQGGSYFTGAIDGTAGLTGGYMWGGSGLLSGPFCAPVGTQEGYTATANTHVYFDATEGIATRITTRGTPIAGDNVGLKTKFPITCRALNFRLYFRFRINTAKGATTDHRAWFGLWNNDGDVGSSNAWLPGVHGIGIGYDALTTTNPATPARGATWHVVHNDATGGQTLFDELQVDGVGITNNNTIVHQCIIQSEETPTPRFLVNLDGGTLAPFTTGIPGATIPLRLAMGIEITTGVVRSVDIFDIKINQWK